MGTPGLFVNEASPSQVDVSRQRGDDEVSLSSTIDSQHDSDEEWAVEGILYEVTEEDGHSLYLVEWTGYPLEECTWEPRENVLGSLMEEWEAKKKKQARGEEKIFDIRAWQELVEKRDNARRKRHQRRNYERKRRGLPLSLWEGESKEEYYSSDEEVGQDDYNAIFPPPNPIRRQDAAIPSVEGSSKQSLTHSAGKEDILARKRTSSGEGSKSPSKQKATAATAQRRQATSAMSSTAAASAASTSPGYQGTAKKPRVPTVVRKTNTAQTTLTSKFSQPLRTAKKTQARPRTMNTAATNVFVGGKPIRTRNRLSDNVADTTQTPRPFSNMRLQRQAELQSRDKADQAPASLPAALFKISSGPPTATKPSATGPELVGSPLAGSPVASPSATSSPVNGGHPMPRSILKRSVDDFTTRSASESSVAASERLDSTKQRPLPKKRKSVQWTNDVPFVKEPEPMDVDEESHAAWQRSRAPTPPPSAQGEQESQQLQRTPRKLTIQQYHHRGVAQSYDKNIALGGNKTIEVTFENVKNTSEAWHSHFVEQTALNFSRTCLPQTFAKLQTTVVERIICHGNLKAKLSTDDHAVESAAERMKLGSLGAAYFHSEFSVIIYPAACEIWRGIVAEVEASNHSGTVLKYFIYKPYPACAAPLPERKATASNPTDLRGSILQELLRIDYHKLVPPGLKDTRHNFYLAFPPSREALLDTLCEYLHLQNPHCRVFSTKTSGDWRAFSNPQIVEQGVIIAHETATQSFRQFPGLLRMLFSSRSSYWAFWCIGESLQKHPIYPSIRSLHDEAQPGLFELTRLFPHGNAILVTPSFLVAEPLHALQLFSWYKGSLHKPTRPRIVAAAGLSKFLRDLADDRAGQHKRLLATGSNTELSPEKAAQERKISYNDCMARFDTSAIVDSLQTSSMDDFMSDEQNVPIIHADSCIDANDEQSLVNWFGCWSQSRLDQFRKFSVLGTDGTIEARQMIKYEDLPRYMPGTERDLAAENIPEPRPAVTDGASRPVDMVLPGGSNRLKCTQAWCIKDYLFPLAKSMTGHTSPIYAKLFARPVAYCRDYVATADAMGDHQRDFATYDIWFKFTWPFYAKCTPFPHIPPKIPAQNAPHIYNSYLGFFYTPHGYLPSRNKWQGRHPWIAVYRPEHLDERPWGSTELIIWDVTAKDCFSSESQISLGQLNEAQQHLVKYLEENGQDKNPKLPLKRVWLGGSFPAADTLPFDATLSVLDDMIANPVANVPLSTSELLDKGYRLVRLQTPGIPSTDTPDNMSIDLTDDVFAEEDDPDSKVIFHPPRSNRLIEKSRCENLFFKWVKEARKGMSHSILAYTFPPTVDWYKKQQQAENRHFEHIYVGTWERIWERISNKISEKK